MALFTLVASIYTDGDAFGGGNYHAEIERILGDVTGRIAAIPYAGAVCLPLYDRNGRNVGTAEIAK